MTSSLQFFGPLNIFLPDTFLVTLSVYSLYGATPGPWEACPNPFSFFGKTVLQSDKMNRSHFLKETAEQILMRFQVKAMIAQLLSYAIWVTMPTPHGGRPQPVLLF